MLELQNFNTAKHKTE
jgi:ABC-type multidrug transport system ATPase subunit